GPGDPGVWLAMANAAITGGPGYWLRIPVHRIPAPQAHVMLSPDLSAATSQKAHTGSQRRSPAASGIPSGPLQSGELCGGGQLGTTAGIDYRLLGTIEAGATRPVID